jgi:CheY-like chemotaxis protein
MDGYELARRLRQGAWAGDLRLLAITGYDQERDRALSMAAGFHEHLVKPVDIAVLLEMLQTPAPGTSR